MSIMDKDAIIQALRQGGGDVHNFLQSASNGVADQSIGSMVDLANGALGVVGVPTVDNPVMGTKWMREKGITRDVQPGVGQVLGEGLGGALGATTWTPAQLSSALKSYVSRMK